MVYVTLFVRHNRFRIKSLVFYRLRCVNIIFQFSHICLKYEGWPLDKPRLYVHPTLKVQSADLPTARAYIHTNIFKAADCIFASSYKHPWASPSQQHPSPFLTDKTVQRERNCMVEYENTLLLPLNCTQSTVHGIYRLIQCKQYETPVDRYFRPNSII